MPACHISTTAPPSRLTVDNLVFPGMQRDVELSAKMMKEHGRAFSLATVLLEHAFRHGHLKTGLAQMDGTCLSSDLVMHITLAAIAKSAMPLPLDLSLLPQLISLSTSHTIQHTLFDCGVCPCNVNRALTRTKRSANRWKNSISSREINASPRILLPQREG